MIDKPYTIVHVASLRDYSFSGVCVVVPQHIHWQGEFANVALVNINDAVIPSVNNQFVYNKMFSFEELPSPFNKPDIVVFHEVYHPEYLNISKKIKDIGIPYIIVPHGCLTNKAQQSRKLKKTVGNLLLFNRFVKNAVAIQCLSQIELEETNFGKKKFIGTNGIDIPITKKDSFNDNSINISYIGRLNPFHKGFDLLIEAIAEKKEMLLDNNCFFRIYGPDYRGWREEIETQIKTLEVSDLVKTFAPITGKEKEQLLLNTDIFIQTSRYEGMPLGILEALSYGIPCFVTRGTNLGEIIEEFNAGFVADTTVSSISKTLKLMVEQKKQFKNMSQNARDLVESNFSWEQIADKTVRDYIELSRVN